MRRHCAPGSTMPTWPWPSTESPARCRACCTTAIASSSSARSPSTRRRHDDSACDSDAARVPIGGGSSARERTQVGIPRPRSAAGAVAFEIGPGRLQSKSALGVVERLGFTARVHRNDAQAALERADRPAQLVAGALGGGDAFALLARLRFLFRSLGLACAILALALDPGRSRGRGGRRHRRARRRRGCVVRRLGRSGRGRRGSSLRSRRAHDLRGAHVARRRPVRIHHSTVRVAPLPGRRAGRGRRNEEGGGQDAQDETVRDHVARDRSHREPILGAPRRRGRPMPTDGTPCATKALCCAPV